MFRPRKFTTKKKVVYINQMSAVVQFHVSEMSKFSLYYLINERDVILPLDNIVKRLRIYYCDEHNEISLQGMRRCFALVRNNKKSRKTVIDKYLSKTEYVEFKAGDLVHNKNYHKKRKLNMRWRPYYVVVERTSPFSHRIRNQLIGSVTKTLAEHLRAAFMEEWKMPTTERPSRKIVLVTPVESSDSNSESGADFLVSKSRHHRKKSDDESDVPLMEHDTT